LVRFGHTSTRTRHGRGGSRLPYLLAVAGQSLGEANKAIDTEGDVGSLNQEAAEAWKNLLQHAGVAKEGVDAGIGEVLEGLILEGGEVDFEGEEKAGGEDGGEEEGARGVGEEEGEVLAEEEEEGGDGGAEGEHGEEGGFEQRRGG
jgi:hypothetical protein